MNPHHCEHLKSVPNYIKNKWSMNGNVMLGKLNYRKCSKFFEDIVFNTTFLFHQLGHFSHILPLEQTEETRSGTLPGYKHYQYKYTF
jgi:hypothetical protein